MLHLKKNAAITAEKIVKKYKLMKRPKKTYLVNEKDLEAIDYNELQENLFKDDSIINLVNKVFDFEKFTKDQAEALNKPTSTSKKVLSKQLKRFPRNIKT